MHGKACLVTGAANGIGAATARLMAQRGDRVVAADRDKAGLLALRDELATHGHTIEIAVGDVADRAGNQHMIQSVIDRYGRLDVAVANAGVIPLGDVLATTADDWDQVMAVNGRGMFFTCQNAIAAMQANESGSIVCVSSISGIAGQSGQAAYGPSKFVATGLTKHLAVEWAARGIRINAVAPGSILTAGVEHNISKMREGQRYIEEIIRAHPIGRLGHPDEVARAIAFLASDDASFITGAILPVDGGYLAQ